MDSSDFSQSHLEQFPMASAEQDRQSEPRRRARRHIFVVHSRMNCSTDVNGGLRISLRRASTGSGPLLVKTDTE